MSGYPTDRAKSRASAVVSTAVDAAVGIPASRRTCFIVGLSRHRYAARAEVPGIPHRSRTRATGITCDSIEHSRRSTHVCRCAWRTAHSRAASSVTESTR